MILVGETDPGAIDCIGAAGGHWSLACRRSTRNRNSRTNLHAGGSRTGGGWRRGTRKRRAVGDDVGSLQVIRLQRGGNGPHNLRIALGGIATGSAGILGSRADALTSGSIQGAANVEGSSKPENSQHY